MRGRETYSLHGSNARYAAELLVDDEGHEGVGAETKEVGDKAFVESKWSFCSQCLICD